MRSSASILSPLVPAAMLLFASVAAVLGADGSERPDVRREWYIIANGRKDFDVSDPALVPSQLALAAERSGCRYKDGIKEVPVRFITVENRRLALVFCFGVSGSHQVFDLSNREPKLLEFPVPEHSNGFGTTPRPGLVTWERGAGVFQAETGTDVCPGSRERYTYRLGYANFAIVRVEFQHNRCGGGEWTTIWDAPPWSLSAKPNAR